MVTAYSWASTAMPDLTVIRTGSLSRGEAQAGPTRWGFARSTTHWGVGGTARHGQFRTVVGVGPGEPHQGPDASLRPGAHGRHPRAITPGWPGWPGPRPPHASQRPASRRCVRGAC